MKRWKEQGKIRHIAFSYHDDAAHLDQILTEHPEVDAVQAELNYYKSFRNAYDRAFETGDYTAQTEKIGGAFDVTAAVREAATYHATNNYQTYMD